MTVDAEPQRIVTFATSITEIVYALGLGDLLVGVSGPFDDFPDAYFQESRRLVAPNTLMFRGRRRAREAAETLERLIAEHRPD